MMGKTSLPQGEIAMNESERTELTPSDRRSLQIIKLATEQAEERRYLVERCANIADQFSPAAAQAIRDRA